MWREMLVSGEAKTVPEIAKRFNMTGRYVREMLPLAFLAPEIIRQLLKGSEAICVGQSALIATSKDASWRVQSAA
jgi:hypothetical protein